MKSKRPSRPGRPQRTSNSSKSKFGRRPASGNFRSRPSGDDRARFRHDEERPDRRRGGDDGGSSAPRRERNFGSGERHSGGGKPEFRPRFGRGRTESDPRGDRRPSGDRPRQGQAGSQNRSDTRFDRAGRTGPPQGERFGKVRGNRYPGPGERDFKGSTDRPERKDFRRPNRFEPRTEGERRSSKGSGRPAWGTERPEHRDFKKTARFDRRPDSGSNDTRRSSPSRSDRRSPHPDSQKFIKKQQERRPDTDPVTVPIGTGEDGLIRLNKYLSAAGFCSRRKADELIEEGKVRVNGQVVDSLGAKVNPREDKIFVNEKQVVNLDRPVYIVFNKPKDCITTASDEKGRTTVMDYVKVRERVFPVGRLDRNTTGVLLLTNDGDFANRMMHPRHEVKKAYKATLDKPLAVEDADRLRNGIRLDDGRTEPAEVYLLGNGKNHKEVGVIIHEGRNRQIHRMFEALDYVVEKLDRIAYADIAVEGLARGGWRYLSNEEVRHLKKIAGVRSEGDELGE